MPRLSAALLKDRAPDVCAAALFPLALPFLWLAARARHRLRVARALQDRLGVTVLRNHYYEPVAVDWDRLPGAGAVRPLPAVDWNLDGQLDLLRRFRFGGELRLLEGRTVNGRPFTYTNRWLGPGDAEALYSFIRALRPRTIVEIGSGVSTLVARLAIEGNREKDDPSYGPRHVCFEPFENPWLESTGAEIRRERVEFADEGVFRELVANDIVFLDSSHVVRQGGEVEALFRAVFPVLAPGVLVHVHDVFLPRDYPAQWSRQERRFWTEQYLLEAFLSFNSGFEVVLALNDLHHRGAPEVRAAFPMLALTPDAEPGSFWMRRRG